MRRMLRWVPFVFLACSWVAADWSRPTPSRGGGGAIVLENAKEGISLLVYCSPEPQFILETPGWQELDAEDGVRFAHRFDEGEWDVRQLPVRNGLIRLGRGDAEDGLLESMASHRRWTIAVEAGDGPPLRTEFTIAGLAEMLASESRCELPQGFEAIEQPPVERARSKPVRERERSAGNCALVPRDMVLMSGKGEVTNPRVVRQGHPEYPERERERRVEGFVTLQVVVRADGSVGDIKLLRSSDPESGFVAAAILAAKQTVYEPAQKNGCPVSVYHTVHTDFSLN